MTQKRRPTPVNPALWVMILIPTATVIASFVTLGLAFKGADPELPKSYATEGRALDADLALLTTAKKRGIKVLLDVDRSGSIRARIQHSAAELSPARLSLTLTHANDARRDQKIELTETDEAGVYVGGLAANLEGRWWVQLDHDAVWRLRGRVEVPANGLLLGD
jgi:hypothetical protein